MPFRVEPREYDDPAVVALVLAVQQEYAELYGGDGDDDPTSAEAFRPPSGLFLLGMSDGTPLAMGGFRRVDEGVAEIKRMYVRESARGQGFGRLMLIELEDAARRAGLQRLVLSTGYRQPIAVALYESAGYVPTDRFGHYAAYPGAYFYGKDLIEPGRSRSQGEA